MHKRFNVAIVGLGIGATHIDAYLRLPQQYRVALICDRDAERLQQQRTALARFGGDIAWPIATERFTDVLTDASIDIVDICTPPHLHFSMVKQALLAGKHVICEKPLCRSLAEADAIAALLAETEQQLMPVFQYRFGNGLQKLKMLIDADLSGRAYLSSIETHWTRRSDYFSGASAWRGTWQSALGGALLAQAIHAHDALNYLIGPCYRLQAFTRTLVNPEVEVEDCAVASLQMVDGSLATLSVTLGSCEELSRLRFCFEHLTAESTLEPYSPGREPWTFRARDTVWQRQIDTCLARYQPQQEGFVRQFELFHQALLGNTPLPVDLADGRRSLALVTALYHAAATRQMVELHSLNEQHPDYHTWIPDFARR